MTDKSAPTKSSNNKPKDNKASTITKSANKPADVSAAPASNKAAAPVKNTVTKSKPTNKTSVNKTPTDKPQKPVKEKSSSKISKLAIFALLIALLAVGGVVALYYWHMQQQVALENRLKDSADKNITLLQDQLQEQMKGVLASQQNTLALQVKNSVNSMEESTTDRITQLNQMVEKFSQNQPTDWLVHEAEYLVRVAARTLWLEKDATAAVGLLLDANDRITELNSPEVLPVRQLILQDITTIKSLPTLETEEVILSLIALGEQVQELPLITLSVPQEEAQENNFELSDDLSQWKENLQKTWNKFLETFVVVHSRMGDLEPILPVDQRKNLKENLSLKLQVAQWAASKGKEALFIKSLEDVQTWLLQYFNMEDNKNITFNETIEELKSKRVHIEVDNKLVSLQAIRNILEKREVVSTVSTAPMEATLKGATETVPELVDTETTTDETIDSNENTTESSEDETQESVEATESKAEEIVDEATEASKTLPTDNEVNDSSESLIDATKDKTEESIKEVTEDAPIDNTSEEKETLIEKIGSTSEALIDDAKAIVDDLTEKTKSLVTDKATEPKEEA